MNWTDLNPATIAVSGDWHGNYHYAERVIRYAKEAGAEAILHVGDFGYTFEDPFLSRVRKALRKARIPLGFVDGNHDNHTLLGRLVDEHGITPIAMQPNIFYLPRTYRWEWSGLRFLALGGAHSVDRPWRVPGVEWWPDETITWQQVDKAIDDGPADVMICHDVPAGIDIPWIAGNPQGFSQSEIYAAETHRNALRKVVNEVQPKHLYAGHYHGRLTAQLDGYGYETTVDILDMDRDPIENNTIIVDLSLIGTK